MKKEVLAFSLILVLANPGFASGSLIPQFLFKNHHQSKNLVKNTAHFNDEYVDFSGHWIGSCDDYPEEEAVLDIELASDFSSINIDNINYPIDAISTQSTQQDDKQYNGTQHIRWSLDGQELLITKALYYKEGSLIEGGLLNLVGNIHLLMNNEQLITNHEQTIFFDGILEKTSKIHCVYNNQNK